MKTDISVDLDSVRELGEFVGLDDVLHPLPLMQSGESEVGQREPQPPATSNGGNVAVFVAIGVAVLFVVLLFVLSRRKQKAEIARLEGEDLAKDAERGVGIAPEDYDEVKDDLSLAEVKAAKQTTVREKRSKEEMRELRRKRRAKTQTQKAKDDLDEEADEDELEADEEPEVDEEAADAAAPTAREDVLVRKARKRDEPTTAAQAAEQKREDALHELLEETVEERAAAAKADDALGLDFGLDKASPKAVAHDLKDGGKTKIPSLGSGLISLEKLGTTPEADDNEPLAVALPTKTAPTKTAPTKDVEDTTGEGASATGAADEASIAEGEGEGEGEEEVEATPARRERRAKREESGVSEEVDEPEEQEASSDAEAEAEDASPRRRRRRGSTAETDDAAESAESDEQPRRRRRRRRGESEDDQGAATAPAGSSQKQPRTLREGLNETRTKGFVARLGEIFERKLDDKVVEELEEILFTADIGVKTSQKLLAKVQGKLGRKELADGSKAIAFLREAVLEIIEPSEERFTVGAQRPYVVLVVGVNGAGKTTTIGKMAAKLADEGHKVLLIAGDTFRAAAIEQLEEWGARSGCHVHRAEQGSDPSAVMFDGLEIAKKEGYDVVLADTAGRLHNKKTLVEELKKITRVTSKVIDGAPHRLLLVLDATNGQNALVQAKEFRDAVDFTGIILTKLDGTAKGGVIIGICDELDVPIHFVGIGEMVDDLRAFDAKDFVTALF